MSKKVTTVRALAVQLGLDFDEALVTLWDAGFESIDDIDDRLRPDEVRRAQLALGVGTLKEFRTLSYWQRKLGLKPEELRSHLAEMGIKASLDARVLPKGSLAKLRKTYGTPAQRLVSPSSPSDISAVEEEDLPAEPQFEWRTIGQQRQCTPVSVEEVSRVHEALEKEFEHSPDPITPVGVRDAGLLESALYRTETAIGGQNKYESVEMAAAALLHSLIHNHAFFNGNKRTALVATLALLDRNNLLLTCDEKSLFRLVLRVAQHRLVPEHWSQLADREVMAIAEWIRENSRPIEHRERALKWRELKRILTGFECAFEGPLPGNKLKIRRRTEPPRRVFARAQPRELVFHASYAGEGREVGTDQLHRLRKSLELDDAHGYDSGYFYGSDSRAPDEFISEYRNILKRLAKL